MKIWMKGFAVGLLAIGLAACSDNADVNPDIEELEDLGITDINTDADETTENEKEKKETTGEKQGKLTTEEVFTKTREVAENQESMHAKMYISQNIVAPDLGMDMKSDVEMDMDMVQEPFQMHQVMKMDMGEEGIADVEMYMMEESFLMKDPTSGTWMKLPVGLFDELNASMSADADPNLDFAQLEEFADDFTLEETNNEYILKLKASGEKFNILIQDQLSTMDSIDESATDSLEDMTIHQLDYEIFIDKKTFNTTAFNMMMDMEMEEEGGSIRIVMDMKAEISQINEINEIIIPQEILDAAVTQ